jgi:hypothetical protein
MYTKNIKNAKQPKWIGNRNATDCQILSSGKLRKLSMTISIGAREKQIADTIQIDDHKNTASGLSLATQ